MIVCADRWAGGLAMIISVTVGFVMDAPFFEYAKKLPKDCLLEQVVEHAAIRT
jgi:hypothetical protein